MLLLNNETIGVGHTKYDGEAQAGTLAPIRVASIEQTKTIASRVTRKRKGYFEITLMSAQERLRFSIIEYLHVLIQSRSLSDDATESLVILDTFGRQP